MTEETLTTCPDCGHIEWIEKVQRGECRICALFSRHDSRTISM
jgi:hypothetical protein